MFEQAYFVMIGNHFSNAFPMEVNTALAKLDLSKSLMEAVMRRIAALHGPAKLIHLLLQKMVMVHIL